MASLGTLALDVIAKTMPFERSLKRAQGQTKGFAKTIQSDVGGALTGFQSKLALVTGGLGLGGLATFSIKAAADLETTKTQFETMLGSAEKADKIVGKLFDFSKKTPFEPTEIFGAGKGLLGAGFREDEIMDPLRRLGDIAAGSGARLEDLVRIFGKVKSTGKVELETLNQLAERNAVSYNDLAKSMGVTTAEMTKMISAGKVGLPEITAAIRMLTDEGGKFAGGMEAQSKTLDGLFSTLKGNISAAAAEIGTAAIGATDLKGAVSSINEAMEATDWKAIGQDIADAWKTGLEWADKFDGVITSIRLGVIGLQQEIIKATESPLGVIATGGISPILGGVSGQRDERAAIIAHLQRKASGIAQGRLERQGRFAESAARKPEVVLGPEATDALKQGPKETMRSNDILSRILSTMRSIEQQQAQVKIARA